MFFSGYKGAITCFSDCVFLTDVEGAYGLSIYQQTEKQSTGFLKLFKAIQVPIDEILIDTIITISMLKRKKRS